MRRSHSSLILAALALACAGRTLPQTAGSFETARRWLYERVQHDHRQTLYCGCAYDDARRVDLASCGMEALADAPRARQVEAEHVVPAARLGSGRACWTEPLCERGDGERFGGRTCCERIDPWFEAAHNDLHNLFPAVGQVNNDRRDYAFAEVLGEVRAHGGCDIEIDREARTLEPAPAVRGEIARTWLYMDETYGLSLSPRERALFRRWAAADPPEGWELMRNARIRELQGRGNRFVE